MRCFHGGSPAAVLLALSLVFPFFCQAAEIVPFRTFNQSPLVQIYGLPAPEGALLLPAGRNAGILTFDVANNFTSSRKADESVLLDGETSRVTLSLRRGTGNRFEAGLDIPFISHSGGVLDGFIEGWHDFFGLPQGGREQAPRERLLYQYRRDATTLVDLQRDTSGLGDIRITGGWQFLHGKEPGGTAVALRSSLKLPTGDSDRLLGSGSTDLALWVSAARNFHLRRGSATLYGSSGALFLTDGDVLPRQQRNLIGFATLGAGWSPLDRLVLQIQFDGHTAFYDGSDLQEVGDGALLLTVGGSVNITPVTSLQLAVSEDIVVHTSPDVVFHLSLRRLF